MAKSLDTEGRLRCTLVLPVPLLQLCRRGWPPPPFLLRKNKEKLIFCGVEQDPWGSKIERVKKKTCLLAIIIFFFKWRWVLREGKGCGASLEQEASKYAVRRV